MDIFENEPMYYGDKDDVIQRKIGDKLFIQGKEIKNALFPKDKEELEEILDSLCNQDMDELPDLSHIYVGDIVDFSYIFHYYGKIKHLNGIRHWNTMSGVVFTNMFSNCDSLSDLSGIENFVMLCAKDTQYMFTHTMIKELSHLSKWKMTNVEDMSYMFGWCTELTSVEGISSWDIQNVKKLDSTFIGCESLSNGDGLYNWKVKRCNTFQLFRGTKIRNFLFMISWELDMFFNEFTFGSKAETPKYFKEFIRLKEMCRNTMKKAV